MNRLKRFGMTSFIYLIGTVFSKALMFLLLPIYTKYLSPATYGLYDLSITYNTLVFSVLYLDIFGVIMRFMYDFKNKDKDKPISNGFVIFAVSTLVYTLLVILLGIMRVKGFNHPFLLILIGVSTNLQQTVGFISRAYHRNKTFVIGGMLSTIVTFFATFLFLVIGNRDYEFIYVATITGMLVSTVYMWHTINLSHKFSLAGIDSTLLIEMSRYALPLSVNSAAIWFLTGFNRFIISNQLSLAANGFYAVATKFSGIVNLVTTGFQMAFQELVFEDSHQDKEKLGEFYTSSLNAYIGFLLAGVALVLPVLNIVFPFLVDSSFNGAKDLVPLALLSAVFSSVSSFLASMLSALKKTRFIFTTTVQAAVVNVVIVLLLIGSLGVQAANISLTLGFGAIVFARLRLVRKFVLVKLDYNSLALNLFVFALSSLVFINFSRVINFFSIFIIAFLFFIFNKQMIRILYSKVKNR